MINKKDIVETKDQKISRLEKCIKDFKSYDIKRTSEYHKLLRIVEQLKKENANLKKSAEDAYDTCEEIISANETAPGTIVNPGTKAIYFELTERLRDAKRKNKALTKELNELKKGFDINPDETYKRIESELLEQKSVAIKDLRKENKLLKQFISVNGLSEKFNQFKLE